MIRFTRSNLLDANVDALVNAVNTVGREPSDFVAGLELQWSESALKDMKP